jgi:hypothetical protein
MSGVVELLYSRRVPQVAALALMSIGFAGCSGDMSTRFSENPFASQSEATGTVPPAPIERRELPQYSRPQYQSQALPPPISAPQSYPTATAGVSGGGRGLASYTPPAHPIETTGSVPHSVAAAHAPAQGTTIIVGQRIQGAAHPFSGSAADHSASDRGCRSACIDGSREQAGGRRERAAFGSCRQSRRYVAQYCASQSCLGR